MLLFRPLNECIQQVQRLERGERRDVEIFELLAQPILGDGEQRHLRALVLARAAREPRPAALVELAAFEILEDLLGALDDERRETGELRDVDAVAAARRAFDEAPEKDNLALPVLDGEAEILYAL